MFLELGFYLKDPVLRPLVDICKDKLWALTGRSRLWQVSYFPRQSKRWGLGIWMSMSAGGDSSFAELSCKCVWWSISRTSIAQFVKESQAAVEADSDLFD